MWLFRKKEAKDKKDPAREFLDEVREDIRRLEKVRSKKQIYKRGEWTLKLEYNEAFKNIESKGWTVFLLNVNKSYVNSREFETYEGALEFFNEVKKILEEEVEG